MQSKVFIMSILFIVALLFVGCGGTSEGTPEEAVANAINAIKQLDEEKIERYFPDSDPIGSLGEEHEDIIKLSVENISFNIISSSINGDSATAEVAITNIDMGIIFGEYLGQAMDMLSAEVELTYEEMDQIFLDLLKRPDNEMVTITVTINLAKNDDADGWIIDADEAFADAIFGGMLSAVAGAFGGF